jgi:hypothetical protein
VTTATAGGPPPQPAPASSGFAARTNLGGPPAAVLGLAVPRRPATATIVLGAAERALVLPTVGPLAAVLYYRLLEIHGAPARIAPTEPPADVHARPAIGRVRHDVYDITAIGTWVCWAVVGVVLGRWRDARIATQTSLSSFNLQAFELDEDRECGSIARDSCFVLGMRPS